MNATPQAGNQRGRRSRQEILDAAARVMSARGYAGTSLSALVEATGLPKSAIYHHFGSKAGLLSEVMARGAHAFFAAMQQAHQTHPMPAPDSSPRQVLGWYLQKTGEVFVDHENFLRLLLVLVMGNEATDAPKAMQTIIDVRDAGRDYMRHMIYASFKREGEDLAAALADELSHFGMAGFDGAFVSIQSGDTLTMTRHMAVLTDAMSSICEARLAAVRRQA